MADDLKLRAKILEQLLSILSRNDAEDIMYDIDEYAKIHNDRAYEQGKADRDKELAEHCVFISNRPIEDIVLEARADERKKVLEILKGCVYEIPYENSAFGYGIEVVDYSKAMRMLKEQE